MEEKEQENKQDNMLSWIKLLGEKTNGSGYSCSCSKEKGPDCNKEKKGKKGKKEKTEPMNELRAKDDINIPQFERDYERIASSISFRALQDKTQVFPLSKSDYVRTRLTHSSEVSTIARQIGIMCFENTIPRYQAAKEGLLSKSEEAGISDEDISDEDISDEDVSTIARQIGIMCFENTIPRYQAAKEGLLSKSEEAGISDEDISDDEKEIKKEIKEEIKKLIKKQTKRQGRAQAIEMILASAGLLHDLGNPPFGHKGEEAIQNWFKKNLPKIKYTVNNTEHTAEEVLEDEENMKTDLKNFEGNAQVLRILLKSRYNSGITVSDAIIGATVKYPATAEKYMKDNSLLECHKLGIHESEKDVYDKVAKELGLKVQKDGECKYIRHPLAYLLEAADDITYLTDDLEDAVLSGLYTIDDLYKNLGEEKTNIINNDKIRDNDKNRDEIKLNYLSKTYDRLGDLIKDEGTNDMEIIHQWCIYVKAQMMYVASSVFILNYNDIMNGTYPYELLKSPTSFEEYTQIALRNLMKPVYENEAITSLESEGEKIIDFLLEKFVLASVKKGMGAKTTQEDELIYDLIPDDYKKDYKMEIDEMKNPSDAQRLYYSILIALDYISGMSDGYAKDLYNKLTNFYGLFTGIR